MASLSTRAPFICRNCIQRLRAPPSGLHSTLPVSLSQARSLRTRPTRRTVPVPEEGLPLRTGVPRAYEEPLPTPGPPPPNRRPMIPREEPLPTPGPPPVNRRNSAPRDTHEPLTPGRQPKPKRLSKFLPPRDELTPGRQAIAPRPSTLAPLPATGSRAPIRKVQGAHDDAEVLGTRGIPLQPLSGHNWYWETLAPTQSQKGAADVWFRKKSKPAFLTSVAKFRVFPESDVPEVAFVGRSNVGKSSLLNALVNADIKSLLARTSKTPGCTTTMNLYGVGPGDGVRVRPGKNNGHDRIVGIGGVLVVDLPGYGAGSFSEWGTEIMKYLTQRKQLRRAFVLIDAVAGITDKDRSILASLRLAGVPHQVLLSKMDKIYIPPSKAITRFDGKSSKSLVAKGTLRELQTLMADIKSEIQPRVGGGALGELLGVSAEVLVDGRKLGVDAVRVAVLQGAGVAYEVKKKSDKKPEKIVVEVPRVIKRPMTDMLMDANGQPAKNYRGKVVKPY